MQNLVLAVDGNWLLMSRLFAVEKQFNINNPESIIRRAKDDFIELLSRSLSGILHKIPEIGNVVVVADGGSWRKELPVPEQLKTLTYKGNRVKKTTTNWDAVFSAFSEWLENCEGQGITVSQGYGIEGDDWMWYWSRHLNEMGKSVIIWSSDCDLKQLVQMNGMAFTSWYNDKVGLVLPEAAQEPEDIMEFFMQPTNRSMELEKLEKRIKKHTYINPDVIAMEKIIQGDSGDNIKSVARVQVNNRTYKVGPKDYEKVMESIENPDCIEVFMSRFTDIAKYIPQAIKKFKGYDPDKILEMLSYNVKLVWLNELVIPETIMAKMADTDYKNFDVNKLKDNFRIICNQHVDESIVEDLPF